MVKAAKENPELLRSMLPAGSDPRQAEAFLDKVDGMDEATLSRWLALLRKVNQLAQPLLNGYQRANRLTRGHFLKLVVILPVILWILYRLLWGSVAVSSSSKQTFDEMVEAPPEASTTAVFEDEF